MEARIFMVWRDMATNFNSTKCLRTAAKILAAVEGQGRTRDGIVRITGLALSSVDEHIAQLKTNGKIHICGWGTPCVGRRPRLYLAGAGEDAPYPVRRKETRRKDGERVETKKIAKQLTASSPAPHKIQRDPFTAAFFGNHSS